MSVSQDVPGTLDEAQHKEVPLNVVIRTLDKKEFSLQVCVTSKLCEHRNLVVCYPIRESHPALHTTQNQLRQTVAHTLPESALFLFGLRGCRQRECYGASSCGSRIHACTWRNACVCWQVRRDLSIDDLRKSVANATSIAVESQRLMLGGKEMPDGNGGVLSDLLQGKGAGETLVFYLVVRFPGASFALPSEDDAPSELPLTVGEESVMRSSRIVLRGTVTIPVPERDMQRVVHSIMHRGDHSGHSLSPSLQDLVSSMSYLPRYRRLDEGPEAPTRRASVAGSLNHRRRRRRRMARASGLAVDLRAHSVTQVAGTLSSLSASALRPAAGDPWQHSWSHYLDLELQQPLMNDSDPDAGTLGAHHSGIIDEDDEEGMFDQHLGLDTSHESSASYASMRRIRDLHDIDQVHVGDDDDEVDRDAGSPPIDWRYSSAGSCYTSSPYHTYDAGGLPLSNAYGASAIDACPRESNSRATRVAQGPVFFQTPSLLPLLSYVA